MDGQRAVEERRRVYRLAALFQGRDQLDGQVNVAWEERLGRCDLLARFLEPARRRMAQRAQPMDVRRDADISAGLGEVDVGAEAAQHRQLVPGCGREILL